jgi:hypothetical protein
LFLEKTCFVDKYLETGGNAQNKKEAHCRIRIPKMCDQGEIEEARFNNNSRPFTTVDVAQAHQATD